MSNREINLEKLNETKHMFEWLSNDPFEEMIERIENNFVTQVPDTELTYFEATSYPDWLSAAKRTDDNKTILVRCGVAFECNFTLQNNEGTYNLNSILSWVGVNLDTQDKQTSMWIDLDGSLDNFGKDGLLKERIYIDMEK